MTVLPPTTVTELSTETGWGTLVPPTLTSIATLILPSPPSERPTTRAVTPGPTCVAWDLAVLSSSAYPMDAEPVALSAVAEV